MNAQSPLYSSYRRKPLSLSEMGPGLRREGDGGKTARSRFGKRRGALPLAVLTGALLIAGASRADQSDMIAEPVAVLQGLDKITARVSDIDVSVGKTVQFGTLAITVRACKKSPPEDKPEDAAFLQIDEVRPGEDNIRRFSGWMFAQSPALSSLEHPVYDVILLDCKAASGSPPQASGSSGGKDAR